MFLFGHIMNRDNLKAVRIVMKMNVEGKEGRERPKKIWTDGNE